LAQSVTPLEHSKPAKRTAKPTAQAKVSAPPPMAARPAKTALAAAKSPTPAKRAPAPKPFPKGQAARSPIANPSAPRLGDLNSHQNRRVKSGRIEPEMTLDLHDHGLDAAYTRLMRGMAQARAMQVRTVLVIAGRSRPVDPADRGTKRGAIRAKLLDWLAASEHGSAISAVRKAHRRHGGEGALYIMLRREG
jgi:DNA-nicking Smr family endonuclease